MDDTKNSPPSGSSSPVSSGVSDSSGNAGAETAATNAAGPETAHAAAPTRSIWRLLPFFLAGVLLALLIFWLYLFLGEKNAEQTVPPATAELQGGVNESLQAEIDRYRAALAQDVCLHPLENNVPDVYAPLVPVRDENAPAPQPSGDSGLNVAPGTQPGTVPATLPGNIPGNVPDTFSAEPGSSGVATADAPTAEPPAVAPLPGESVPPSTVAELMEQATVFVLAVGKQGISMGSGFFFGPDRIFTNYHVINGVNPDTILVTNAFLGEVLSARLVVGSNRNGRDYAVLRVATGARSPAHLSFTTEAQRTDPVSSWGFPNLAIETDPRYHELLRGNISSAPEVVYTAGVISVIQTQRTPPLIAHTAEVSHGSSGGPLIDAQGRVIGVNTQIHVDRESNRQLNVALGSSDINAFLRENNLLPR